ncbi:MAG TPA: 16S rRNA (guanine(527)-N(7))-methyltransferase RsmG [Pyrinomonadaceae bacterium]|nr:16S rRNA (guanine(527)-N(7))-methyltransferase RsmG [Pyrinomonadaceae bacterium]
MSSDESNEFRRALEKESCNYGVTMFAETLDRLAKYFELLSSWNSQLHLVAPTSPREFATRHVLESLLLVDYFPEGAHVADIGSGGGLPMIPCVIARPDITAVLIESSKKKAVFLREALSLSGGSQATVIPERFEAVATPDVNFVTCRALERFEKMLPQMIAWAPPAATLLLFGGPGLEKSIAPLGVNVVAKLIPRSEKRFLFKVDR